MSVLDQESTDLRVSEDEAERYLALVRDGVIEAPAMHETAVQGNHALQTEKSVPLTFENDRR